MAIIYTVEQLTDLYRQSQTETDKATRKLMLNFIVTESVNTVKIYTNDLNFFARAYEIILEEQAITANSVSILKAVGIGSSNIYGYAVAGVAFLYDLLSKKRRTKEVEEGIRKVEALKAKIYASAQLYESAKSDLTKLRIEEVLVNPVVWLVIVLALIIFLSR